MERRFNPGSVSIEARADGQRAITGYASVFFNAADPGTEFQLNEKTKERIAPGAFNRALADKHDVRALFNHDPNHLLGRMGAGTLRLSVDNTGLRYEITPPDTSSGRDVLASIERGDLAGSSFAFGIVKQGFEKTPEGGYIRSIEDVHLYDVGPVTFPAYQASTTGLRAGDGYAELLAAVAAWEAEQMAEAESIAVRMRIIALDNDCQP